MEQQLLHVKRGLTEEAKFLILYFGGKSTNIAGLADNYWLLAEKIVCLLESAEKSYHTEMP